MSSVILRDCIIFSLDLFCIMRVDTNNNDLIAQREKLELFAFLLLYLQIVFALSIQNLFLLQKQFNK